MKKFVLFSALFLLLASLAAAAVLLVTDSGVSIGNNNVIGERKSSWDAAQSTEWIVAWLKIPAGSDQENGAVRYRYKVTVTAPDGTAFPEGSANFPADGIAKFNKPVSYYAGLKTTKSPNPCQGEWKIEFMMIDGGQNNKEDLGALLPFYLTGSDQSQAPTDINEAAQKATDDTVDMSMLAVFNTAKQYGAQQEQSRQVAAATPSTTVTVAAETTTSSTTTTTVKKTKKKKKK